MEITYADYDSSNLTKDSLLEDETFVSDARRFLTNRAGYEINELVDKDYMYDKYMEHFRRQNVNEITASKDAYYAHTVKDDELAGLGRLMGTYDRMDSDFGAKAMGDYAMGLATAPSTYLSAFSFGSAKAGALAANQGVKLGIKKLVKSKLRKQVIRQGAISGGIGAVFEGTVAAGTVYAQEQTRVKAGIKDEMNLKDISIAAGIATLTGGVLTGATGARRFYTSRKAGFNLGENIKELRLAKDKVRKEFVIPVLSDSANQANMEIGVAAKTLIKQLKSGVKTDAKLEKEALEKTIPSFLRSGKKLQSTRLTRFELEDIENIAVAAAKIDKMIPPLRGIKDGAERFTSRITRAITDDPEFIKQIQPILAKHKIAFGDLAPLFSEEISRAGSLLQRVSKASKEVSKSGIKALAYAETKEALNNLDIALRSQGYSNVSNKARLALEKQNVGGLNKFKTGVSNLNKARVGMMTIQAATTVRNTTNGYMRNYIYSLDNMTTGAFNYAKGLTGKSWNHNKQFIEMTGKVNPDTGKVFTKTQIDKILREQGKNMSALGQAQMRNGFQSFFLKDLRMGLLSEETDTLFKILNEKSYGYNDEIGKLLRSMGDIADLTGTEGGLLGVSRAFNSLNTLSDNMFKRAIFSREIDMMIRTAPIDGLDSLDKVIRAKKFHLVPKEYISRSMDEAWEFTYQTSDFASRQGGRNVDLNKFANSFLKGFGSPTAMSLVVPFPRYMVNQLRFVHAHMPILGMVNVGGLLNKSASTVSKGQRGSIVIDAESLGKQVTGLATLGAFIGLRHHFGDENTGPYDYILNNEGYDAKSSLGPFAMFAFLADLFYRADPFGILGKVPGTGLLPNANDLGNDDANRTRDNMIYNNIALSLKEKPYKTSDFVAALTGMTSRAGSQLWIIDEATKTLQGANADTTNSEKLTDALAKLVGGVVNTAFVGAGMYKDISASSLTPFGDNEKHLLLPDNAGVGFWEVFWQSSTRSFREAVLAEDENAKLQSSTRRGGIHRYNPIIKQVTGFTPTEKKNIAENEYKRLGIEYGDYTPRKIAGDTERTNLAKKYMGEYTEDYIIPILMSQSWESSKSLNVEKKRALMVLLQRYKGYSRLRATEDLEEITGESNESFEERADRYFEVKWKNLGAAKRNYISLKYRNYLRETGHPEADWKNSSIVEDKAWTWLNTDY